MALELDCGRYRGRVTQSSTGLSGKAKQRCCSKRRTTERARCVGDSAADLQRRSPLHRGRTVAPDRRGAKRDPARADGPQHCPAVTVAALQATANGDDPLLLVLAADHLIRDAARFRQTIDAGRKPAEEGRR